MLVAKMCSGMRRSRIQAKQGRRCAWGSTYQKLDKKNCKCPNDTEFPRTVGRWAQLIILMISWSPDG